MAKNKNEFAQELRAPTHYDRWVIANSLELAPSLANIFLRKFGHKMREFALIPQVGKNAEPHAKEHWKAQCLRCDKTIHLLREKIEIKRSWEDEGGLAILHVQEYKINYGRLYAPSNPREALHASFSLMDPIPNDVNVLKEYPVAYTKVFENETDGQQWVERGINIPIDSF